MDRKPLICSTAFIAPTGGGSGMVASSICFSRQPPVGRAGSTLLDASNAAHPLSAGRSLRNLLLEYLEPDRRLAAVAGMWLECRKEFRSNVMEGDPAMGNLLVFSALMGAFSSASAGDVDLLCTYERAYDFEEGAMEEASGTFPFTLGYENGQIVDFTTPFPCGGGTVESKVWDDELHISCIQISGEDLLHRYFQINPYLGYFAMILINASGEESVRFGSCTAAERL